MARQAMTDVERGVAVNTIRLLRDTVGPLAALVDELAEREGVAFDVRVLDLTYVARLMERAEDVVVELENPVRRAA